MALSQDARALRLMLEKVAGAKAASLLFSRRTAPVLRSAVRHMQFGSFKPMLSRSRRLFASTASPGAGGAASNESKASSSDSSSTKPAAGAAGAAGAASAGSAAAGGAAASSDNSSKQSAASGAGKEQSGKEQAPAADGQTASGEGAGAGAGAGPEAGGAAGAGADGAETLQSRVSGHGGKLAMLGLGIGLGLLWVKKDDTKAALGALLYRTLEEMGEMGLMLLIPLVEEERVRDAIWRSDPELKRMMEMVQKPGPDSAFAGMILQKYLQCGDTRVVNISGLVPLMIQLVKSEHKEHVFLGASILGEVLHHESPRREFLQLGGLQLVFGLATDALNADAGMTLFFPLLPFLTEDWVSKLPSGYKEPLLNLLLNSAKQAEAVGRYDTAKTAYNLMQACDPLNPSALMSLAQLAEMQGDRDLAKQYLRPLCGKQAGDAMPMYQLAKLDVEDALAEAAAMGVSPGPQLIKLAQASAAVAAKISKQAPGADPAAMAAQLIMQRLEDASRMLDRARVLASQQRMVSLQQAVAAAKQNNLPAPTEADLESLPNDALRPVLKLHTKVCELRGRPDVAFAAAAIWAKIYRQDAVAHFTFGRLCLKLGHHESALTALHRAFVLAPGPEPAYKLAVAAHKIGREQEALQWAKEAVVQLAELDGKGKDGKDGKDKDKDGKDKEKSAAESKSGSSSGSTTGGAATELGSELQRAWQDKQRAEKLKRSMQTASAFRLMGQVHLRLGMPKEALQDYDAGVAAVAAELDQQKDALVTAAALVPLPALPMVHFERGRVLQQLGRDEEAIAAYTRALDEWRRQCIIGRERATAMQRQSRVAAKYGNAAFSCRAFLVARKADSQALDMISQYCMQLPPTATAAAAAVALCTKYHELRAIP